MFDDDKSVLAFLDHCRQALRQVSRRQEARGRRVYMKFPSQKDEDMEDTGKVLSILERHPAGKALSGQAAARGGPSSPGCSAGRWTRTASRWPTRCARRHYVEDRFHVPVAMQEALAKALADAGTERFSLGRRSSLDNVPRDGRMSLTHYLSCTCQTV